MKITSQKMSPLVFVIPFVVAFAVIGLALFAVSGKAGNTDIRNRASNDKQRSCVFVCNQVGGSNCEDTCTGILNGSIVCSSLQKQAFINWCEKESGASVKNYCSNACKAFKPETQIAGSGNNAQYVYCQNICQKKLAEGQTCSEACAVPSRGMAPGASVMNPPACEKMCAKFVTPTPNATGTPAPTSTPTPTSTEDSGTGGGFGDLNCQSICRGSGAIAQTCTKVCNDINSGAKTCPSACSQSPVPASWKGYCMKMLCPSN